MEETECTDESNVYQLLAELNFSLTDQFQQFLVSMKANKMREEARTRIASMKNDISFRGNSPASFTGDNTIDISGATVLADGLPITWYTAFGQPVVEVLEGSYIEDGIVQSKDTHRNRTHTWQPGHFWIDCKDTQGNSQKIYLTSEQMIPVLQQDKSEHRSGFKVEESEFLSKLKFFTEKLAEAKERLFSNVIDEGDDQ